MLRHVYSVNVSCWTIKWECDQPTVVFSFLFLTCAVCTLIDPFRMPRWKGATDSKISNKGWLYSNQRIWIWCELYDKDKYTSHLPQALSWRPAWQKRTNVRMCVWSCSPDTRHWLLCKKDILRLRILWSFVLRLPALELDHPYCTSLPSFTLKYVNR